MPTTKRTDAISKLIMTLHRLGLGTGDPAYDLAMELGDGDLRQADCRHLEPYMKGCKQCEETGSDCSDILFVETKKGYGIPVRDGGSSSIAISHCPFCGIEL